MNITKQLSGDALILTVSGRLDTLTAPALEQEIKADCAGRKSYTM